MSVLAQQHETWRAANNRLWKAEPRKALPSPVVIAPQPKPAAVPPVHDVVNFPRSEWRTILRETADKYDVTVEQMVGQSRKRQLIPARYEAAFRMSTEADMALPAIGRRLNRDHTTILHAIRRHMEMNPESGAVMSEAVARRKFAAFRLMKRVRQMLRDGKSNPEIVSALPVSDDYVRRVLRQMKAAGNQEAA